MSGGGYFFDHICSISNLLFSWKCFKTGKNKKSDIGQFELFLEQNIFSLHDDLVSGKYIHGLYTDFYVCDPKRRHIHKASVRDRVLHQAVFGALYPVFDKHFIDDSYSSRNNKGTHAGVLRLYHALRKESNHWKKETYVLKCDIRKFFDSIDHDILRKLLLKKITDTRLIDLLDMFFTSFEKSPHTGIPLGNVTSQLFANVYLNELDQYIKHVIKAKHYFRYCDDFVIVDRDRNKLINNIEQIKSFLWDNLALELHPGKIEVRKITQGVDFLGYVILPHTIIIRTRTRQRIIRKVNLAEIKYRDGSMGQEKYLGIIDSYLGIVSHASDKKLEKYLKNKK